MVATKHSNNFRTLNNITTQNAIFDPLPTIIGTNILINPAVIKIRIGGPPLTVMLEEGSSKINPVKTISSPPICDRINPVCKLPISLPVRNLNNIQPPFLLFYRFGNLIPRDLYIRILIGFGK